MTTIRPADGADLPAAVTALRAVYEADRYPTAWPADPSAWLRPPGLLASWVASHDGVVVGGVAAVDGAGHDQLAAAVGVPASDLVVVSRLFIAPAGRGTGAARALVGEVVRHGATLGRRAALDVIATSAPAVALYEALGWRRCGTEVATWRTQNGEHPTLHFYLAPD